MRCRRKRHREGQSGRKAVLASGGLLGLVLFVSPPECEGRRPRTIVLPHEAAGRAWVQVGVAARFIMFTYAGPGSAARPLPGTSHLPLKAIHPLPPRGRLPSVAVSLVTSRAPRRSPRPRTAGAHAPRAPRRAWEAPPASALP